jgi:hypothetical protein
MTEESYGTANGFLYSKCCAGLNLANHFKGLQIVGAALPRTSVAANRARRRSAAISL